MNRTLRIMLNNPGSPEKYLHKISAEKEFYRKKYKGGLQKRKLDSGRGFLFCWFCLDDGCLCLKVLVLLVFLISLAKRKNLKHVSLVYGSNTSANLTTNYFRYFEILV